MKFLNNRKGTLTFLLIVLLVVSCFLIVRLEIKAASLQSRLDEHHSELKNNSDELENLSSFIRKINNNGITIDGNKILISAGQSVVKLENNKISIETPGEIQIGNSSDINFGYDKKNDALYMKNKGVSMHMGKLNDDKGKFLDYGTFFRTNSGVQFTIRDEGISGWVPSNNGSYSFKLAAKKKYVELKKDNSIIRFEGDDISIEAPGDINITSKNGKVNINGKR
jgi:hypothetical protein